MPQIAQAVGNGRGLPHLKGKQRVHDLEVVLDPMMNLAQQGLRFSQRPVQQPFGFLMLTDLLPQRQDAGLRLDLGHCEVGQILKVSPLLVAEFRVRLTVDHAQGADHVVHPA